MASECKKAGKILASFVDPRQAFGPDKIIPPEVLANAKGLAILTVIKAGFLGSARFGSGLVVARLADGSWSAPSAIATGGAGFGGQIGFELTDFVFVLNNYSAVKTFSQQGSLTLGGNISVAAGPVGRNAEAAGTASLKGVAAVFSYSKTKGLFAGVSIEGSAIVERRDANEKLYKTRLTARQLLEGGVRPPPEADALLSVLNSRVFAGVSSTSAGTEAVYNDIPVYDSSGNYDYAGGPGGPGSPTPYGEMAGSRPSRAQTYGSFSGNTPPARDVDEDPYSSTGGRRNTFGSDTGIGGKPARPTAPKPAFKPRPAAGSLGPNQALAKFTFEAAQAGDLGFKKGEIITIVKRTENESDWWTGRIGTREGIFPRYVHSRNWTVHEIETDTPTATMSRRDYNDVGNESMTVDLQFFKRLIFS